MRTAHPEIWKQLSDKKAAAKLSGEAAAMETADERSSGDVAKKAKGVGKGSKTVVTGQALLGTGGLLISNTRATSRQVENAMVGWLVKNMKK